MELLICIKYYILYINDNNKYHGEMNDEKEKAIIS